MFDAFQPVGGPPGARKRAAVSTAAAAGAYVLMGGVALLLLRAPAANLTEHLIDVAFQKPAVPRVVPPPPPPPPKKAIVQKPRLALPAPAPPPPIAVPREIPKEAPSEEPRAPVSELVIGGKNEGVVGGVPGGTGTVAPAASEAAPSAVDLPEEATPPQALTDDLAPSYPEAARAAGLEGMVILKFVVARDGKVTGVKVLKGESPFVEAAIAKVKTLLFKPAMLNGAPIAVFKVMKFPFRLSVGG